MHNSSSPLFSTAFRLQMIEPHPIYSVHDGKGVYGISRFSLYVNRLKSIIAPCTLVRIFLLDSTFKRSSSCLKAREAKDARDKYFVTFVSEFDAASGVSMIQKVRLFLQLCSSGPSVINVH